MSNIEACCDYAAVIALDGLYAEILREELTTADEVRAAITRKTDEINSKLEGKENE